MLLGEGFLQLLELFLLNSHVRPYRKLQSPVHEPSSFRLKEWNETRTAVGRIHSPCDSVRSVTQHRLVSLLWSIRNSRSANSCHDNKRHHPSTCQGASRPGIETGTSQIQSRNVNHWVVCTNIT